MLIYLLDLILYFFSISLLVVQSESVFVSHSVDYSVVRSSFNKLYSLNCQSKMYQRNMGAGFNFHNLIGFAPSIRFHQQPFVIQQPFSDSMRPHRNLMGSSAPLDFIPVQRPSVPQITSVNFNHVSNIHTSPPQQTVKKKRPNDDLSLPPNKRAKFNSHNSPRTLQLDRPTSSVREEDFLVPVNHGTEEITIGIWDYFLTAHMKDEDLKRKLKLRKCLLSVMSGAFPNCRLFLVGSSMTGFATRSSDVDMCLMITDQEIDQKYEATVILNSISRVFRKCSFMRSPQVIKAKVPIFKFFDAISQVECDLNINNIVGIRNTHLLRYYAYMDWRVRPLMLFIKFWARFHDINDASKKTISSYSLTLMLIHYLQAGVSPPVLPCLHSLKPHLFSTFNKVYRLTLDFDENNINFISRNNVTLGELFLGFLNYYANRFDYNTQVISVRLGKAIHRREVNDSNNSGQWKFLNIEEPFDKSNTARSVFDYHVFQRILRVFKVSYNTLEKSRNVKDILSRPF